MTSSGNIAAIVPAFNEARTIGNIVAGLLAYTPLVIVVDDLSSDDTAERAKRAGAVVVGNVYQRGYDGALNTGFAEAARRGTEVFFTFDADGEHAAEDVPQVLGPILKGVADIVAGQRPYTTHLSEKVFALYTRLRYGVADPLCGFKAYRRAVYDSVGHFDSVESIGTELMLKGIDQGYRLALVPIKSCTRHEDTSRFYRRRFRANLKILKAMFSVIRA